VTRPRRDRDENRLPPSERMVAFTDAAVAIALTLLVLPLVDLVPEAAHSGASATTLIAENLAPIGAFLLSFAVIARFWTAHHRLFGYEHRLTRTLVQLNLLWVLTIAVLPFPTEMIASFASRPYVVPIYIAVLCLCAASLSAMTILMRRTALKDRVDDGVPESFVVGSLASTTTIVIALVVVLVAPQVGPWAFFILLADPIVEPVIRRLRGDRAGPRTA
jgi:uncharacterized membrane protein